MFFNRSFKMATSSFTKDFTLDSKKAVESFVKIVSTPTKSIKIDRTLTSQKNLKEGAEKLSSLSLL